MDIGIILAGYPKYFEWAEMMKTRVNTLQAYRTNSIRSSGGQTSDSVGRAVVVMIDNNELRQKVALCEQFVNGLKDPRERAILLGVWRGLPWRLISEGAGMQVKEGLELWQDMVKRLKSLYVGDVCELAGGAYVPCQYDCQREQ